MKRRLEGATLPGLTVSVVDDTGTVISDGLDYTWTCQASLQVKQGTVPDELWEKTTGITATETGFTIGAWTTADVGSLTAVNARDTVYTVEFTGTASGGRVLKHQESVTIGAEIP